MKAVRILGVRVIAGNVVRRSDANHIEDAEGAHGRAGGQHPGLVDGLHVGDIVDQQILRRAQEGHQKGVQDVARLLLLELQRDHTDLDGEVHHLIVGRLIGTRMAHDLGGVAPPDAVGKVEGEELLRPAGGRCQHAGQEGGGVGGNDGLFRQKRAQLLIEFDLGLGILRQRLDDQIRVLHRLSQVGAVSKLFKRPVGIGQQPVEVHLGEIGLVEHKAPAHRAAARLCGSQLGAVDLVQPRHFGLGTLDGGLAAQIDGGVEARIGGLVGDLAAQHAAADQDNILKLHKCSLL